MHIAVIGAGYVGLTTAACFAHLGHDVVCADIDAERVARLNKGEVPILEHGLARAGQRGPDLAAASGSSSGAAKAAAERRDRVPVRADAAGRRRLRRPLLRRGRRPRDRARAAPGHRRGQQVDGAGRLDPVRAARALRGGRRARRRRRSRRIPEFLREGQAVRDFLNPDRIVIGCDDRGRPSACRSSTAACKRRCSSPIPASAEMIKYASNAFLATKVSFINAIANLCEAVDADVREVAIGMGYDTRIGFQFLHPGPGLRRIVLPEGRLRAAAHVARPRATTSTCSQGVVDVNRGPARAHGRQDRRSRGRRRARRRGRRALGPHVQGRHRRPAATRPRSMSRGACSKRARSCAAYDPAAGEQAAAARAATRHRGRRVRSRAGRRRRSRC